jgi:hypothetical protein
MNSKREEPSPVRITRAYKIRALKLLFKPAYMYTWVWGTGMIAWNGKSGD